MNRTVLTSFTVLCLLSTLVLMEFKISVKANPDIIYVPTDYPTIQEAINNANEGDTIYVRNGTYYENVVVDKSLSLIGEDRSNTFVDGNDIGNVINITANNVNITGFTIRRSMQAFWHFGIYIVSSGNNIGYNVIANHYYGAIRLSSLSNNNNIYGNTITKNSYGISLQSSRNNNIYENNIEANNEYGISATVHSNNNNISDNIIANNWIGFSMHLETSNNIVSGNSFANNSCAIRLSQNSSRNIVYHNDFINNTIHIHMLGLSSSILLDDGYPSGGNFWSDYTDIDLYSGPYQNETGYDWIGDSPYVINGNNQDNYPLVKPYEPEMEEIRIAYRNLLTKYNNIQSDLEDLNSTVYTLLGNITDLQEKYDSLLNMTSDMQEQIDSLNSTCKDLQEQIDDLTVMLNSTRDNLQEQINSLNTTFQTSIDDLQEQVNSLNLTLYASIDQLQGLYNSLNSSLQTSVDELQDLYDSLNSTQTSNQEAIINELGTIRTLLYVFIGITVILIATTVYLAIRKPKKKP